MSPNFIKNSLPRGRFPETLNAKDKNGRTPLHYAATIPDNGHYFNILLNLGADRKIKDNFGHAPSYYLEHSGELTQDMLMKEFNAPAQIAREILSDKVPNDTVSSRRHLQDDEVIEMLNQCKKIIQSARDKESHMPLVKFLTNSLFDKAKLRITKNDRNLLDVIWPGIRILQETGIGKLEEDDDFDEFDMSGGVIAPDYESYIVFEDLMFPMIKDMHSLGGKIPLHPKPMFFKKDISPQVDLVTKSDPEMDNGGIIAPDYESYQVFEEVMIPIVKDIHGIEQNDRLRNHPESEFFKEGKKEEDEGGKRPKTRKGFKNEDEEKEDNVGMLQSFKNKVNRMVKRSEEETDSEEEVEKKPKRKGVMKTMRERMNQAFRSENESESEGLVDSIKNRVKKFGRRNVEPELEKLTDNETSAADSDGDLVTEKKGKKRKSEAMKKEKKNVEEEIVDRSRTATIRRGQPIAEKPTEPTKRTEPTNAPYKLTRTQKLREELRLKQEEESRKQKEEQEKEKEKSKVTKQRKEVNILILDHDEKNNVVETKEEAKEEIVESEEKANFLGNIKEKVQRLMKGDENGNEIQINENPSKDVEEVLKLDITDLDPTSKYILSAKIECSRNLVKYQLPATLREDDLDIIERKLKSALKYQSIIGAEGVTVNGGVIVGFGSRNFDEEERYYTVQEILTRPSTVRAKLAANELLIPLAENTGSYHCSMLHGNFWPNYRGVYLSKNGNLAAWINVQEHLRIVSCTPIESPGNVGEAYARMAHLIMSLDKHLKPKRSPRLGFLTSRPCCLGNTLRFQALIRLPMLAKDQIESVMELCKSKGLILSRTKESDYVFKIRNRQCLGINEYDTYNNFATTVMEIIQLEKDLAQEKSKHVSTVIKNIFSKRNTSKQSSAVAVK